jgi:hypothetical protein
MPVQPANEASISLLGLAPLSAPPSAWPASICTLWPLTLALKAIPDVKFVLTE